MIFLSLMKRVFQLKIKKEEQPSIKLKTSLLCVLSEDSTELPDLTMPQSYHKVDIYLFL